MEFLIDSFRQSDVIGQWIVFLLLVGSLWIWPKMLFKHKAFSRAKSQNRLFLDAFKNVSNPLGLCLEARTYKDSPTFRVYIEGCECATRVLGMDLDDLARLCARGPDRQRLTVAQLNIIREAAEQKLADEILDLENEMHWLPTAVTVAPFFGLFGTVLGVMQAFNGMAASASPTSSAVISGISSALLTTVCGLGLAIPTVIYYNFLTASMRTTTVQMDNFVQSLVGELHLAFVEEE